LPQPNAGHPVWSPKNEILVNYAPTASAIVQVTTTPRFSFGLPAPFARAGRAEGNPGTERRAVAFMPDGEQLIGLVANQGTLNEFVVVINWFDELRQAVPVHNSQ
jgi:hypothetical protein